MPLPRDDIAAALPLKGFEKRAGDHWYYHLVVGGKKTGIATKLSHGSKYKDYDDSLLALVARQLHLTKKQLVDLVRCPLSFAQYVEILKEQNVLEADEAAAAAAQLTADVRRGTILHEGRLLMITRKDHVNRQIVDDEGNSLGVFTVVGIEGEGPRAFGSTIDLEAIAEAWRRACLASGVDP